MNLRPFIMTGSTIIVGLNGALQKRFVMNTNLVAGNVHRATHVQVGVGGKGQDVAATLTCLQYSNDLQIAQFIGSGPEGDKVHRMLQELLGEHAMSLTVRSSSGMRTCTSIVSPDVTTELVEPSGTISQKEMKELMDKIKKKEVDAICFMGSMPPGCPSETYADIYKAVATSNTLCLIDSVVGLEPLLQTLAECECHGPTILKINASELCRLAGVEKSASEVVGILVHELVQAITSFITKFNALSALTAICITDGAHPSYVAILPVQGEDEFRLFQLPIANIKTRGSLLYPIGAGDAVAAGTIAAWKCLSGSNCLPDELSLLLKGNETPSSRAILAAFSFGLACGSASCLQEQNSVCKIQDVRDLYNKEGRPTFISSHKVC